MSVKVRRTVSLVLIVLDFSNIMSNSSYPKEFTYDTVL